jgi:RsiW-degrading membrane proteinase PrsW (M82 family)
MRGLPVTIRVSCPHCGKAILAPEKAAGRQARCPACDGAVTIPAESSGSRPTSAPGDVDFDVPDSFTPQSPQVQAPPTTTPSERIRVNCGSCGKTLAATALLIGKTVRCPNCRNPIKIEAPAGRAPGASTTPHGQNDGGPDSFDAPLQSLNSDTAADPNDPFAYLTTMGLDALEGGVPAALPPVVQGVKRKKRPKSDKEEDLDPERPDAVGDWTRIFLYAYMGLALIPLAVTMFLPDSALEGTHLSEDSQFHWVYAGLSVVGFLTLLLVSIRSPDAGPILLILVGLFTGTVGIVVLLLLQAIAFWASGFIIRGRGIIVAILLLVKLIGLMYYYALSADSSFWASFYGFTLGVGLCEELCKLAPVIWYLQNNRVATWKGACLVGLASGIGFGVSEGVHYSAGLYNGNTSWEIYVVRFVSCVALHAAWTATIACTMYRRSDLGGSEDFGGILLAFVIWLGVPVLLHGMYDTLLKFELNGWALMVALLTIAWMSYAVERASRSTA